MLVLAACAAVSAPWLATGAHGQSLTILHHEPLVDFELTAREAGIGSEAAGTSGPDGVLAENAKPQTASGVPPTGHRMSFSAFGRRFDAVLEKNDRLLHGLDADMRGELRGLELYQGRLEGLAGSWIRLSRHGGELSAALWDGSDLYAIEPRHRLAALLVTPDEAAPASPVIYRLRDTVGTLSDLLVGAPDDGEPRGPAPAAAPDALASSIPTVRQINIGLVADVEMFQREGDQTAAKLLEMVNIVDGLFTEQVGIRLHVAEIDIHESEDDPFSEDDPLALLGELESHKGATPALADQGLAHLFTRRTLGSDPQASSRTVGIANVGVLCEAERGVALTEATFGITTTALIAAHEIGHNFGAPHDGVPGPCVGTGNGYLMAPGYGGSSTFSQCSIDQMAIEIGAADCLETPKPTDLSLSASVERTFRLGAEGRFLVVIDNLGPETALGVAITFDGPGIEVLEVSSASLAAEALRCPERGAPMPWTCTLARIPGDGTIRLRVDAVPTQIPAALDVTVAAQNDPNSTNDAVRLDAEVEPLVQLDYANPAIPGVIRLGETVDASVEVRNVGYMEATGAIATIEVASGPLELNAASIDGTACTGTSPTRLSCVIGALSVGDGRIIELTARANDDEQIMPGTTGATSISISIDADQPLSGSAHMLLSTAARFIADLELAIVPPATAIREESAAVNVVVRNLGPDDLVDVEFSYFSSRGPLDDVEVGADGDCEIRLTQVVQCEFARIGEGEAMTVRIYGTSSRAGVVSVDASASSASYDLDLDNNDARAEYEVLNAVASPEPSAPGGSSPGGGGGGTGIAWLLALLATLLCAETAARRSRRRDAPARFRDA